MPGCCLADVPQFGHDFIDRIDPVWPAGVPFCHQVVDQHRTQYCYAYEDQDGPLWAWGVIQMWEGVGSVWMIFDLRAHRSVFRIMREARISLKDMETQGFKRLQGEIHVDAPTRRIASILGFDTEGILRQYGIGGEGDFVMVARIS